MDLAAIPSLEHERATSGAGAPARCQALAMLAEQPGSHAHLDEPRARLVCDGPAIDREAVPRFLSVEPAAEAWP